MIVTHHAVERYRQFHMFGRPSASLADARAELEAAVSTAIRSGQTRTGDRTWMVQSLGIEFVSKHDDGVDYVVTVLPPARFRAQGGQAGLTPLQVEAVSDSLARAETSAEETKAALAALPGPPAKPSATAEGRREDQRLAIVRGEVKRRHQIAIIERDIMCDVLRTVRHQMTLEQQGISKALAIALKYLRARATRDLDAGLALALIDQELEARR